MEEWAVMSDVYQCPNCELRFVTKSELEMHRTLDHPRPEVDKPAEHDDEGQAGGER
jgi:hypothetical protein